MQPSQPGNAYNPTASANSASLLQSFNGAGKPLHVLFALILSKKLYNTATHIAVMIGCDRETAALGLKRLSALGLATYTPHGWLLTSSGKQLILSSPQFLESGQPVHATGHSCGSEEPQSQPCEATPQCGGIPHPPVTETGETPLFNAEESRTCGNFSSACGGIPHTKGGGGLIEIDQDHLTPPPPANAEISRIEHFRLICESTALLWDAPLQTNAVELASHNTIEDLVAKIAEINHCRSRFPSPAGVVYAALKNARSRRLAASKYYKSPADFLPLEFIHAARLDHLLPEPLASTDDFDDVPGDEADVDETPACDLIPGTTLTAQAAWEMVLSNLEYQTDRSTFAKRICPAHPIRFEDGVFWVGASDQGLVEFLAGRFTQTIGRLLTGILNRTVAVRFRLDKEDQ